MSVPTDEVRSALLELGLEDVIALPNIPGDQEIREIRPLPTIAQLADALVSLLDEGLIQVWAGHWSRQEEVIRDRDVAVELLRSEVQYLFNSTADLEKRVYFVNVENLRS